MEVYSQQWDLVYLELCEKVAENMPEIQWQDLWHNQINFLEEEHPFTAPAVFYSLKVLDTEDLREGNQDVRLQIDIYLYYETLNDTYHGAYNQGDALEFLRAITKLHVLFHETKGAHYTDMRRVGFRPVDTGSAGNLYVQSFIAQMRDTSAANRFLGISPGDTNLTRGDTPVKPINRSYQIP